VLLLFGVGDQEKEKEKEQEKEKLRRQGKPLPTLIREKEPLCYRVP
jgi:hypothetical protein